MGSFASGYIKYVNHLEQINDAAISKPEIMIKEVEESYQDHLKSIANKIATSDKNIKVCMLAGPSSSGKTTTAHLLKKYLSDFGKNAHIVSLDNFYHETHKLPVFSDGSKDYESVHSLDVESVKSCIKNIVDGKDIDLPEFDFTLAKAVNYTNIKQVSGNEIFIIEGIHGLNPLFTKDVVNEQTVKLYVSVKQSIKDANGEVISPMDIRLVRRIVRDIQFRSSSLERTLSMWKSVVDGENRYIRPYRLTADYTVNSTHIYEPCVFRTMAIPLLREIPEDNIYFRKARDIESKLMRFEAVDASYVPDNSLLREFIGQKSNK